MPSSPRPRGRPSNRTALLAAAQVVVQQNGAAHLTLEAIAARSGTTKGAVLYHFHSKEALLAALVEHARADLAASLDAAEALATVTPMRLLEAYVRQMETEDAAADPMNAGIIAAAANEPALLAPFRKLLMERLARLTADGISPVVAGTVLAALDGIWISESLGIPPFGPKLRRRVLTGLANLARQG